MQPALAAVYGFAECNFKKSVQYASGYLLKIKNSIQESKYYYVVHAIP